VVLGFVLKAYTLSHSASPFFAMGLFQMEFIICPDWLQTMILLIAAS
jgi:hypothetical protein